MMTFSEGIYPTFLCCIFFIILVLLFLWWCICFSHCHIQRPVCSLGHVCLFLALSLWGMTSSCSPWSYSLLSLITISLTKRQTFNSFTRIKVNQALLFSLFNILQVLAFTLVASELSTAEIIAQSLLLPRLKYLEKSPQGSRLESPQHSDSLPGNSCLDFFPLTIAYSPACPPSNMSWLYNI